jgi:endonuclease/exonuclease/phosphatase family metal-dependent hydrolase
MTQHTARRTFGFIGPCVRGAPGPSTLAGLPLLILLLVVTGCQHPRSQPAVIRHQQEVTAHATQESGDVEVALLTYNIWGLPRWLTGASSSRFSRISHELQQWEPEIVFLQEVWLSRAYEALPHLGAWSVARGPHCAWFRRPSGLVTLSRFPILSAHFHPFRARAWPDSLVQKGALKLTVDLGEGRRLNLWNVHLQAGPKHHHVRTLQITELGGWVRGSNDGQIADLVAGDFNCTPDSPQYEQLAALLGWDVHTITRQEHFVTYDGRSANPTMARTLDYVFVRPQTAVRFAHANPQVAFNADRLQDRLSDHLGIHVNLNLELTPASERAASFESLVWNPIRSDPLGEWIDD